MHFLSTKGISPGISFKGALFTGMPADGSLYMPASMPQFSKELIQAFPKMSYQEIAYEVISRLIGDALPMGDLQELIQDAFNFKVPIAKLAKGLQVLELYHGPSYSFKDFGARFMARMMSYYLKKDGGEINILVATSGDTGSAVGQGFDGVEGVNVYILYPKGKISKMQEKQLTTLGKNVTTLEVDGVFDDCQALVKEAFIDLDLRKKFSMSSANSINIGRLIPQIVYYVWGYSQRQFSQWPLVITVPSGNFGNLCGCLMAKLMGIPIDHIIAATNMNNVVPDYLETAKFRPRPSIMTLSNAMDVGNPSNFGRIQYLLNHDYASVRSLISGYSFDDDMTRIAIAGLEKEYNYLADPHTAVAYLGMNAYLHDHGKEIEGLIVSTAHPAKFLEEIQDLVNGHIEVPKNLQKILDSKGLSISMTKSYSEFREYLLSV